MSTGTFTIPVRGPFALAETANFGFGQRDGAAFAGVFRLAFCVDGGYDRQVGVEVRQDGQTVTGVVHGDGPPAPELDAVVRDQVARMLSLDVDGTPFGEIGRRDPVVRRLQLTAPGLRPPLFHSPYEAAAWAVLSARRPARQMMAVRQALAERHGRRFVVAGEPMAAFPTPRRLLEVDAAPGLSAEKIARLHGVARAALDGRLEASRLQDLGPEAAAADLRRLDGIGPFYAELVTVRATGFADLLPVSEPRVLENIRRLYGFPKAPTAAELAQLAEPWRPLRTWVAVLIRAAASRLSDPAAA